MCHVHVISDLFPWSPELLFCLDCVGRSPTACCQELIREISTFVAWR